MKIACLFMMLALPFLFLSTPAEADLVGLWRFDAPANPQPDSSPFGNDAEVIDATWVDDPERGGVMQFEGEGDNNPVQWLEVEDSDSLSIEETGLTIAAWANFAQFESWNSILAKTGESAQNQPSPYDLYTNRGTGIPRFFVGEAGGSITPVDAFDPPELEVWTHIAVTIDEEGEVLHYLNGEENGDGFIDRELNPLIDQDQNLFIGSRLDGTTNMHGFLDDVAIFNHALTEEEIGNIVAGDFSAYGIGGAVDGDYNGDGKVDAVDIDLQAAAMKDPNPDLNTFDENGDGVVDQADRLIWVKDHANTWVGDSNLEGEFNSSDLVAVFTAGKFELDEMASWTEGDWDGDMRFASGDLVAAFTDGGYELGPRPPAAAVPEPSAAVLLLFAWLTMFIRRRQSIARGLC